MLLRYPVSTVIVAAALALTAGVFLFARPVYHAASGGESIRLPKRYPAADAAGPVGWQWTRGVPGWAPGQMLGKHHDFNVSGVQPVELVPAEIAAARTMLDASQVRVVVSLRPGRRGPLAILAAPDTEVKPRTCLAALLPGDAPVRWQCPTDPAASLGRSRVLLVAERDRWPNGDAPLWAIGVARGDVARIVETNRFGTTEIYRRGDESWGDFTLSNAGNGPATLRIYGDRGLAETLRLNVKPATTRVVG